jgi:hypothetical protein
MNKSIQRKRPLNHFKEFTRFKGSKFILRKEHSLEKQAYLIYLRYGTLKHDQEIVLTLEEIWKKTGVKPCSQLKIYKRWRQRGFMILKTEREKKPKLDQ